MTQPHDSNNNRNPTSPSLNQKVPRKAWMSLAILGSALLIAMYGETMLLPAIPDIIEEFDISYNTASWILSAYLIAGAVATPLGGKLSDIYGRKKMVMIILIIYIIGITLGGISSNITFLIVARVIQGIGISMFPIAFGIIRDQFPIDKLAIGVGVFSSMFAAGSVVGLALGANIIENFGWRTTFFSIVFVAIGLWFIIRRYIDDRQESVNLTDSPEQLYTPTSVENKINVPNEETTNDKTKKNIDMKGTITLGVTVISLLMVLSYSQTNNIGSYEIAIFLCVGIASLVLFVIVEKKSKSPLINFQLMANKTILSANIILVIAFLSMFTIFQTIPVLVRSPQPFGFGESVISTANIQLPFMIVFLLFAPSSGFIVSKLGNIKPTIIGSIVSALGFSSLFLFHSNGILVSTNLAIIAGGLSLMQVGGFDIVLQSTPRKYSGISLGMTVLFNLVGGSVGPAVAGIYMQANQVLINGVGSYPSPNSYNLIFLNIALASLIPIVLSIYIKKTSPHKVLIE
ncbi:MAG TPA: MFS transporter [Nitrososphaeraceae archaeon]|nr:MFS transporter [Nitrososphaeraceae archaeon]